MNESKSIAKNAISGMRKVLTGKDKAAQCWDVKLTASEKKVLLLTAKLDIGLRFKQWEKLQNTERKNIYEAAYRASKWASDLGLINHFPEVEQPTAALL